jgi:hypothetical protein
MQDIVGIVEVMDKSGKTKEYLIPMYYCANCRRFYILEETAKQYRKKGILLCRIISANTYKKNEPHFKELRDESILKQYGYSVSQEDSLSEEQRQRVLVKLIDKKIVTKTEVLSYLDFFCRLRGDVKSDAVYCWKKDRNVISEYNTNTITVKIIN